MPKLIFSLICTIFGTNNKNPMGFKFSDRVFPYFWPLEDLIYANYMQKFFSHIFTLGQDTSTKLETSLDFDEVHRTTKLVTMATCDDVRINYLLF